MSRINADKSYKKVLEKVYKKRGFKVEFKYISIRKLKTSEPLSNIAFSTVEEYVKKIQKGEKIKPLVVIENMVTDGHHRFFAFRDLGIKRVPILLISVDKRFVKKLRKNGKSF